MTSNSARRETPAVASMGMISVLSILHMIIAEVPMHMSIEKAWMVFWLSRSSGCDKLKIRANDTCIRNRNLVR
jgi:hypothetical protein